MRAGQLVSRSFRSSFRNRLRTVLTAVAVAVGAFALALTAALQTGVDEYIDRQLATVGAPDLLFVTKDARADTPVGEPRDFDPERSSDRVQGKDLLDDDDLDRLADVYGIEWVQRTVSLATTWMGRPGDDRFMSQAEGNSDLVSADLAAGRQLDRTSTKPELLLPVGFLERFGFNDASEALGKDVVVAVEDYDDVERSVTGTIIGVQNKTLQGGSSTSLALNTAMTEELFAAQNMARPAGIQNSYLQAVASVDTGAESTSDVKLALGAISLRGQTYEDQLGEFRSVVDIATTVLTAFAGIALVAAGFGIVNTLLMSVKERTREIGLFKALGLGRGALFLMFSIESLLIGVVGALAGIAAAVGVWFAVKPWVETDLVADLPNLDLLVFSLADIATITVTVVVIAVAAGTLPALRASRLDPVTALRHE